MHLVRGCQRSPCPAPFFPPHFHAPRCSLRTAHRMLCTLRLSHSSAPCWMVSRKEHLTWHMRQKCAQSGACQWHQVAAQPVTAVLLLGLLYSAPPSQITPPGAPLSLQATTSASLPTARPAQVGCLSLFCLCRLNPAELVPLACAALALMAAPTLYIALAAPCPYSSHHMAPASCRQDAHHERHQHQ